MVGGDAGKARRGDFDAQDVNRRIDEYVVDTRERISAEKCGLRFARLVVFLGVPQFFYDLPVGRRTRTGVEIAAQDSRAGKIGMRQPLGADECLGLDAAFTWMHAEMRVHQME